VTLFHYLGFEQSFYGAVFITAVGHTRQFGSTSKQLIGLCGMFVGVGEIIGTYRSQIYFKSILCNVSYVLLFSVMSFVFYHSVLCLVCFIIFCYVSCVLSFCIVSLVFYYSLLYLLCFIILCNMSFVICQCRWSVVWYFGTLRQQT